MSVPQSLKANPLIVALDVDTLEQALTLAEDLEDVAGAFKLGPRLIHRYGESVVKEIAKRGPVFVDCKFFDIPSTMISAVRASFDSGATLVTVHAQAGKVALTELAKLESELNQIRPFQILCVTMLTSFSDDSVPKILKPQSIAEHVKELAALVKDSGLTGIICSAEELSDLQEQGFYLVTPGIRFTRDEKGDQKRILGPQEAIVQGASALVVGRPILTAANPRKAAVDYSMAILHGMELRDA